MLEPFVIAIQIILIDIVMAADNAIIIGLIAANFAPQNKKKIIALGGINQKNVNLIQLTKAKGIASIEWIKKTGLKN